MNEKHFAIRTIRDGKIKVGKQIFTPDNRFLPYDGRLDRQRFAFCRYLLGETYFPLLYLWGTEKSFHNPEKFELGLECVEGTLPWVWWYAQTGKATVGEQAGLGTSPGQIGNLKDRP